MMPVSSALIVGISCNCSSKFCTPTNICAGWVCCWDTFICFTPCLCLLLYLFSDFFFPYIVSNLSAFCTLSNSVTFSEHLVLSPKLAWIFLELLTLLLPCRPACALLTYHFIISVLNIFWKVQCCLKIVFTSQSIRLRSKDGLVKAMNFIMINVLFYSSQ